jgi:hypothetical protein
MIVGTNLNPPETPEGGTIAIAIGAPPTGWFNSTLGTSVVWDHFWIDNIKNIKTKRYKTKCKRCKTGMLQYFN